MSKEEEEGNNLVFAVNGKRFEVSAVDPATTLLEFLRHQTPFKSVKLGCGEGGCGACVVLVSRYDAVADKVEDFTVSSCLTLLCSVNGCSVTTSEGLGSSKSGFHPIHKRFAGFHASQCGFCTPGMCMSLFSALVNANKADRPEPPKGFSKLTVSEAERAIAGNLCRCTGYRPIADVCKSFASDVDMEDLGFNSFWRKGDSKQVMLDKLPRYDPSTDICTFPEFLKKENRLLNLNGYSWHTPGNLKELRSLLLKSDESIKLVVGNTSVGYYKEIENFDRYFNLRQVPELSMIRRDQTGVEIGAAVTISRVIQALNEEDDSPRLMVFKRIANHLEKIATVFIRNSASIGGNLVMAQRNYFPSDISTVLLSVGATVDIMSSHKCESVTLEDFLKMPPLCSRSILLSIKIPNPYLGSKGVLFFETYRAAPRPLGSALPHLNAAFLAEVAPCNTSDGIRINNSQLAFGSYGTKHAVRARKVEEFLIGKVLSVSVIYEATKLVRATVVPDYGTSSPAYRSSLAIGYLFEFLSSLTRKRIETSGNCLDGYKNGFSFKGLEVEQNNYQGDQTKLQTMISSAKQVIGLSSEYHPVGEPVTKAGAAVQASGEAVFVDDIPSPAHCLYGAFIYSTRPLARIMGINFKSKMLPSEVTAVLSCKDIPEGGENIGSKTIFGPEPLFSNELTECAGQRVAFVVADTQKNANRVANSAVVNYDVSNTELPILSVEEAEERSSFFEVPPFFYPNQIGDLLKGMDEADQKIIASEIKLGSQYYFYIETQSALAVPDEDNCMVVYSSIQCPEYAHAVIAKCLGIPEHNVRVITRRVGGGFGGKAIKAMPVATACALAAYKLCRPVRTYVNRKTDMIMAGGRHPMKITYSVGFKYNGKITALQLDILIDAGMAPDISPAMPHNILEALKKYDWGAFHFDVKVCKTNLLSRSAMRAPGEVQGSYIAEAVIEHVASSLAMEVDVVRNVNLHTYSSLKVSYEDCAGKSMEYTLPSIWNTVAISSNFSRRIETIKEFNKLNVWRKRGISRVPIVHKVILRPTPGKVSILSDGSVVVEVGGIELGQGLWTKVKQMAAFGLSSIQCVGSGDLLEKVRVIQSDTLSLIQGGFTTGSTTSESSCEAVRLCCQTLVDRLTPLKETLLQQKGSVNWETLVLQAHMQAVNLSASSFYVPDFSLMSYLNYGAAVSEVEVNLLTGETTILFVDIIYDCGQSLNPAVDLGQIEGAFVQGLGFFMLEEYQTNSDGLVISEGTWDYKIPTLDTIPKQFNVEILNSGHHQNRVLSSKASGEPPLLLAASVHCATRAAIKEARKQLLSWSNQDKCSLTFVNLGVPATMPVVKELCGLDSVERYLEWKIANKQA